MDIKTRIRLIRAATPDCVEELFEMQNRICDLCEQPIQDLILCELDHSIPVMRYAKCLDVSIEDAIRECNHPDNLRAAHFVCNHRKSTLTRQEWFDKKLNEVTHRFYTDEDLLKIKICRQKAGLIGGPRGGRKVVEKQVGIHAPDFDRALNGRKFGRLEALKIHYLYPEMFKEIGRRNVESGQLASLRTSEHQSAAARISGRQNVESGHLRSICSSGGKVGGRKHAESGHCANISAKGHHIRWHVKRGLVSLTCNLCRGTN